MYIKILRFKISSVAVVKKSVNTLRFKQKIKDIEG